jgi:hypothetical protein
LFKKYNGLFFYDNNDNINQQLATESTSSVAKEKK